MVLLQEQGVLLISFHFLPSELRVPFWEAEAMDSSLPEGAIGLQPQSITAGVVSHKRKE